MSTYPKEYKEEEEVANTQAHSPPQRQQNSSTTVVVSHRQNTNGGHKLSPRYIPVVFFITAWIVVTLTIVAVVIDYVRHIKHMRVNMFILNIFCMVFSILALVAECREFAELRAPLYVCIKYIYIITYPRFRAFFYIFLGTLLLDDTEAVLIAAAVVAMLNGVIILIISFICDIPTYYDVDERFQSEHERVSYYSAKQRNSNINSSNPNGNTTTIVKTTSSTKQSVNKTEMPHLPQSASSVVIENNRNSHPSRTDNNTNPNQQDKQVVSKKTVGEVQYGANNTNPLTPHNRSYSPFHSATNSSNNNSNNNQNPKGAKPGTTRSSVTAHYASTSPLSTKRAQPNHSPDNAYAEYQKQISQK